MGSGKLNLKAWTAVAVLGLLGIASLAQAQAQRADAPVIAHMATVDVPGPMPVVLAPVSPADAETRNAGRVDHGDQNKGIQPGASLAGGKTGGGIQAAAFAVPAAPIPASVAELARALKYDPVLIYEFVHNNVEYLPIWGMLKGSEGTITDGMGTSFDIAQLTADLINADPAHGATATLVRGTISMPATTAASWLGLNGMNGCPIAYTFSSGGIPVSYTSTNAPKCTGTINFTSIGHVWVKVVVGGTTYEIDPGFKTHTQMAATVDLPTVTGYSRSSFLAAACESCNTNPNIVTTLNRASILNVANAQSYPKFARNLLSYLQSNNIHDLKKVIGGTKIDQIYPSSLPKSLPYTVASRISDPFTIDGTWKASIQVNLAGAPPQLFSSDYIYGKRLTVTFNGSNQPQLNVEGSVVATGSAVTPGTTTAVKLSICLPFSGINCSDNSVNANGYAAWCSNPAPVRCVPASITSASSALYAVTNSWGPISNAMVERHRIATIRAANAGLAPTAEANLGEVMTTQGNNYAMQSSLYLSLSEDGLRNGGYNYFVVGISGHTGTSGGPYVDLPGVVVFPGITAALNADGTYSGTYRQDNFLDSTLLQGSVYESTSVNQLSGMPAVSTAKLMDIGISQTTNNNVYDLKSCTDYTTYNGSLVSYSASAKSAVQDLVCNQSYRVILPQRGNLSDPAITTSPKWTGAGYYGIPSSATGIYWSYINGGYAGGFSSGEQTREQTAENANDQAEIIVTGQYRGPAIAPAPSGGGGFWGWVNRTLYQPAKRAISDPVDQVTGAFLNEASDLSIGEIGTARLLSLDRSYTTGDISIASSMGQGWKNNLEITAQATSDGVRPSGAYDAWEAAEMLVLKMVNRDLMSDPALPAVNIAVASIGNRWLGDRLVNNVVAVDGGTVATSFQRLADDSYNPGQFSTARLAGAPAAWTVTSADGTALAFNAADATGVAKINTITQPSGIVTSFSYTFGLLSQVSNNLGRTLNLSWTGSHITTVTDTPLAPATQRTVSFTYSGNLLQTVTDVRGGRTLYCYDGLGRMTAYYLPTEGSGTNCSAAGAHITNAYDTLGRVKQQTDGASHVTDLYLAGTRSEVVTHPGSGVADIRSINYLDNFGNVTRALNPRTGLATSYSFDALSRLVRTDLPEGGAVEISYDVRSNPTRTCSIPKTAGTYPTCDTSSGSTQIWTTTSYNEGPSVWACAAINTCNKPASVTDPLGNVTTISYRSDGQVDTATSPTPSGYAGAPKTVNSYVAYAGTTGTINLLDTRTITASAGSPPSIVTKFGYDTAANGRTLLSATLDPSGLNYTTSYGYDGYGNQTSVRGPRTDVDDTVTTTFNADRQPVTITYPISPVTQITYNGDGRVTSVARKLGGSWMVSCNTYTASGQVSAAFGPYKVSTAADCSFGDNTAVPKITYGYDGADRLFATTVAEPSGDRITQLSLYPDSLTQTRTTAAGTPVAATETFAYSNDGMPISVTDARGNVSGMGYDGFDRLTLMNYPLTTGGGPSGTDVVAFAYDKRSALLRRSIRGTSDVSSTCTQCISFTYDELGRLKQKTVPATAANTSVQPNVAAVPGYNVFYHFDLIGRPDSQGYSSSSPELAFAYDNASHLTSASQFGRTVTYSYGPPSQGFARTMTWPSSAGLMVTCTDALGRVSQIKEAAGDCATATNQLVGYGYDDLSRRISVTRANSANTSYTYKDTGALDTLSHAMPGGGSVSYGFGYNRVLQITSRTTDNDQYAWTNHYNVTRNYTANGLDQYGQIMGDTPAWDARGNLTAYRGVSYGFDGENRLVAAAMSNGTATAAYDPAGRLRQIGAAVTSQLIYDGDAPIAEYNASSGAIISRFVPGPGVDDTVATYDASGNRVWHHLDAQGSVVAQSDATGTAVVINQYGPNGEPGLVYQGRNAGRIRYTGQIYLPELAPYGGPSQPLYSFKARIYAPKLGRFLQTDPIGKQGGSNLYAYVANDPINRFDSSGLFADSFSKYDNNVSDNALAGDTLAGQSEGVKAVYEAGLLAAAGLLAGPEEAAAASADSVWSLNPFLRGQQIEQALGHNLPGNFPVIDRFAAGVATSIKSLNLDAATYQSESALARTLNSYVNKVAGFQGATWAGTTIRAGEISGRALDLAIPHSGSAAQQAIINQAVTYGASRGVAVNIIIAH